MEKEGEGAGAGEEALRDRLTLLPAHTAACMDELRVGAALAALFDALLAANKYFQTAQPWVHRKRAKAGDAGAAVRVGNCLHLCCETVRIVGILLTPVLPECGTAVLNALGVPSDARGWADLTLGQGSGMKVRRPMAVPFQKLEVVEEEARDKEEDAQEEQKAHAGG